MCRIGHPRRYDDVLNAQALTQALACIHATASAQQQIGIQIFKISLTSPPTCLLPCYRLQAPSSVSTYIRIPNTMLYPTTSATFKAATSGRPVAAPAPRPVSRRLVTPVRASDADRLGDKASEATRDAGKSVSYPLVPAALHHAMHAE